MSDSQHEAAPGSETYVGGLERNKHERKKLRAGHGTVGKTAVIGAKDRATNRIAAQVVDATDKEAPQDFLRLRVDPYATVITNEHGAYAGLPHHRDGWRSEDLAGLEGLVRGLHGLDLPPEGDR